MNQQNNCSCSFCKFSKCSSLIITFPAIHNYRLMIACSAMALVLALGQPYNDPK